MSSLTSQYRATLSGAVSGDSAPFREGADWAAWTGTPGAADYGTVALWWKDAPPVAGERTATLGNFSAPHETLGDRLLAAALQVAQVEYISRVFGPMNGSTWRTYRLTTEVGSEPPFLLDLTTPAFWPKLFRRHGFTVNATYTSALEEPISSDQDPRLPGLRERWRDRGVVIESPPLDELPQTLRAIHRVSLAAFTRNHLYTPLGEKDFLALYAGVEKILDPRFVLLARHRDEVVGFLFAVPNHLETVRGETLRTLIIKSVAVRPERAYAGLGKTLLAEAARRARQAHFTRLIHAFMHEQNVSRNLNPDTTVIRRYALLEKSLS